MVPYLEALSDFKIVIICDDSGSMKTPIQSKTFTRWTKQCNYVKQLLQFCLLFNPEGVDIHFLNGTTFRQVKESAVVDQIFRIPPNGYTPLVPILERVIEEHESSRDSHKKLLLLVGTDGEPTNHWGDSDVSALEHLMMEKRPVDAIYVSFLVFTDKQDSVAYLARWDQKMANVSITDDFYIEREKCYGRLNSHSCSFSLGDYLVKMLVGAIFPDFDRLLKND